MLRISFKTPSSSYTCRRRYATFAIVFITQREWRVTYLASYEVNIYMWVHLFIFRLTLTYRTVFVYTVLLGSAHSSSLLYFDGQHRHSAHAATCSPLFVRYERFINISHFLVSSMKKSYIHLNSTRKISMNKQVIHNKGCNLWKKGPAKVRYFYFHVPVDALILMFSKKLSNKKIFNI